MGLIQKLKTTAEPGLREWEVCVADQTLGKLEPGDGDGVMTVYSHQHDSEAEEIAIGIIDLLLDSGPDVMDMNKAFQGVFVRRVGALETKWRKFRVFIDFNPELTVEEAFGEEE